MCYNTKVKHNVNYQNHRWVCILPFYMKSIIICLHFNINAYDLFYKPQHCCASEVRVWHLSQVFFEGKRNLTESQVVLSETGCERHLESAKIWYPRNTCRTGSSQRILQHEALHKIVLILKIENAKIASNKHRASHAFVYQPILGSLKWQGTAKCFKYLDKHKKCTDIWYPPCGYPWLQ